VRAAGDISRNKTEPLADPTSPPPTYERASSGNDISLAALSNRGLDAGLDASGNTQRRRHSTTVIARSARYPRVAVFLGVNKKWHVPLLLCRMLSTVSAIWWASNSLFRLYGFFANGSVKCPVEGKEGLTHCLAVTQIGLAFIWVSATLLGGGGCIVELLWASTMDAMASLHVPRLRCLHN